MIKLARSRFTLPAATAIGAGCFVGGTLAAEPLSKVHLDISTPMMIATIFLLGCAYLALNGFRRS